MCDRNMKQKIKKNERIELICCICVDCITRDWPTQRGDVAQIPVYLLR